MKSQLFNAKRLGIGLLMLVFVLCAGGCADFTAGPAPLEKMIYPATVAAHPRAGYVFCARGWLGIFSTGMMELANRIDTKEGISAVSTADMEYYRLEDWLLAEYKAGKLKEPLVLLGHSYGADDMIRVAERLKEEKITVDLLVLIDPVTPPLVPDNVKRVYCVYKSHPATDWYPAWRGVAASAEDPKVTPVENIDLRTTNVGFDTTDISHPYIDKSEGVHNMVIEQIKMVCPTRVAWEQGHPAAGPTAGLPTTKPATP